MIIFFLRFFLALFESLTTHRIIEGAADGRGRGKQVISTARTCNLILVVLDAGKPLTHKKIIEAELFSFGIRVSQAPPEVKFVKKESGGIGYQETTKQTKGMNPDVARLVCKEYKISCAEIILREDITVDQFIDVLEGNRAYVPVLYVFNKIDVSPQSFSAAGRGGCTCYCYWYCYSFSFYS
jgi:ribosome-interacting GTPase 1